MRRILVDLAPRRAAEKRGLNPIHTELTDSRLLEGTPGELVLAVPEALELLAQRDPVSAKLVKLRYFVGLNMTEAAESLGLPVRSAERLWTFAKSWLRAEAQAGGSFVGRVTPPGGTSVESPG